jgi:hypothetical protein
MDTSAAWGQPMTLSAAERKFDDALKTRWRDYVPSIICFAILAALFGGVFLMHWLLD